MGGTRVKTSSHKLKKQRNWPCIIACGVAAIFLFLLLLIASKQPPVEVREVNKEVEVAHPACVVALEYADRIIFNINDSTAAAIENNMEVVQSNTLRAQELSQKYFELKAECRANQK